ncbi:tetratricopeptide repeat protein 28 [Patella vulgata]|uniref:tetratricopeptide repeat protein 28 n=1 Tax=Patella vulgata TaxID=6465 RepID=UPI00217FF503|nr:tetratricopeptide repeat protein 28 [Patella vulgata]
MMKWSYSGSSWKEHGKKAYLREGVALQQLEQHGEALAAFASGLAQEPTNAHLLAGLADTALKSPLRETLAPTFQQLERLRLNRSPFVVISVIGQELLATGYYAPSTLMLESALKIGTCSLKLRGSVFSALSSGYWGLGNIDKAIQFMQQDLSVAKSLGDQDGECRAYGNLGSAHFSKGQYKESLTNHRYQLVLAMKLKQKSTASAALSSLGHVYTAIGDYPNALASHKQCVLLLKQDNDKLSEAREIGNVGAVYLAMGNFDSAVECHHEHLKIARLLKNSVEEARAYSNLGSAYHYKRDYNRAMMFHQQVLKVAEMRKDRILEARAYAGLGHSARCTGDYDNAKGFHEKQLDNALQTSDKVAESRACANLGIIYHQLGEYEAALKLHKMNLKIAKYLGDKASQGRAFGNIGNAYSALGQYDMAIKYHKQELGISSDVNDRHSEGSTHGNLAVAYQALCMYDNAIQHYIAHLNVARELKDASSEARALCNLGNFHCARKDYSEAIQFYEQYLNISQELHDSEGESKACFHLGYAHFSLGNHLEAIRYYEQDLAIARERKNRLSLARAYCNLGLAHKALQDFTEALECQKKCLGLMNALKNGPGKFRALGNIGDLMLKTGDTTEAIKIYNQQLQLAKQLNDQELMASANGSLGVAYRAIGQNDKALAYHTQELNIYQELENLKGECHAHGHLGNVHMSLGKYLSAYKCYEEQLERSRDLHNSSLEAQACGNLGITKMNMGQYEDAIGLFEEQLAMLEQAYGNTAIQEKGRAFGNLGDCYEALGDYEEAIKCHEQFLATAQQSNTLSEQDRAYRGLGNAHRSIGNLQQALVCFEKRLVVAHEVNSSGAKASAYGELGCLHSLLGNYEQAISCLEHQLSIAREMGDEQCEGDAACGLGGVYQQMGEYETALKYHKLDLQIAERTHNTACQCRAFGNLGLSFESLSNYEQSVKYQEQHLSIAAQMNDKVAKTLAYSSLGRVHHALGHHTEAVQYLKQGLQIAEQLSRREDEAKIRHRLGLALWGKGDLNECQQQLYKAADLFEMIRRESQCSSDYKLSLFDLQTACYQALQRVLVALKRHDEALVVAERACTRAFIDLLLERQAGSAGLFNGTTMDLTPITIDQLTRSVSGQKSLVLSFSIAAGYLYSWLLTPKDGLVKFHEINMAELEADVEHGDIQSVMSFSTNNILDQCIGQIRETMGVDSHLSSSSSHRSLTLSRSELDADDSGSETEEVFQNQLEELGDRLNAENDRTGFLRMVNRSHQFNSSSYSISSLFSLSSNFPGNFNRKNSVKNKPANKSPLNLLYQYLFQPMEEAIEEVTHGAEGPIDLVLVLQGDLYLIPFMMLKKEEEEEYFYEKFNLIVVPSISALQNTQKMDKYGRPVIDSSGALVVGNPKLTPSVCQHWHLKEIPGAEYEARIVGELLSCRPLIGAEATKGAILHQLEQVEVIHFATHISWKLSSVILSPGDLTSQRFSSMDSDNRSNDINNMDGPALSEYLLTAADILNLKLHAKLVVINSGYTDDKAGRINTDGVVGLTRSLLSAGAQCVLFSLWPVPDQATKLLMRNLYKCLQDGERVTEALSKAVKIVQCTKQFSHPSNWGGWVLVGCDIRLSSKTALMGHSICEILQSPTQCREAMRVLLHLIEKSLQRIQQGTKNSMYTTFQSIENKVANVIGWKDLLLAVGFRFEQTGTGLPPAVFFPQSDPSDRLTQASSSLQALLGLPPSSVTALSKFVTSYDVGAALITVMRDILNKLSAKESGIDVMVNVKLWRVNGCHEFLASLGLDLVEVGQDNVTLRLSKQAVKRHLQFALQSLVAVFEAQEAPRTFSIESSSSMESLSSSHSSSLSYGSTPPPLSPRGRGSMFNPAEMEKIRSSKNYLLNKGGLVGKKGSTKHGKPTQYDPAIYLSHQNKIRNMYPASSDSMASESPVFTSEEQSNFSSPSQEEMEAGQSYLGSDSPKINGNHGNSVRNMMSVFEPNKSQKAFDFRKSSPKIREDRNEGDQSVVSVPSVKKSDKNLFEDLNSSKQSGSPVSSSSMTNIDHSDLAKRILADVSMEHKAVQMMQQMNLAKSRENSRRMREEEIVSENSSVNSDQGSIRSESPVKYHTIYKESEIDIDTGKDFENKSSFSRSNRRSILPKDQFSSLERFGSKKQDSDNELSLKQDMRNSSESLVSKSNSVASGSRFQTYADHVAQTYGQNDQEDESYADLCRAQGAKIQTQHTSKNKYPFQSSPSNFLRQTASYSSNSSQQSLSSKPISTLPSNLTSGPGIQSGENSISSENSEGADSNPQSSISSGYHSEKTVDPMTKSEKTNRDSYTKHFVSNTPANSISSLPSFRPYNNPVTPLIRTNALQNRPESTASTGSQYSSASSSRSVIYRPSSNTSLNSLQRNGASSILRSQNVSNPVNTMQRLEPVKSQYKKKVSFSDSDRESSNTSFEEGVRSEQSETLQADNGYEYLSLQRSYGQQISTGNISDIYADVLKDSKKSNCENNPRHFSSDKTFENKIGNGTSSFSHSPSNQKPIQLRTLNLDKEKKPGVKSKIIQSKC